MPGPGEVGHGGLVHVEDAGQLARERRRRDGLCIRPLWQGLAHDLPVVLRGVEGLYLSEVLVYLLVASLVTSEGEGGLGKSRGCNKRPGKDC